MNSVTEPIDKISQKTKITYGLGGLGRNIAYGLVASYTLYYYNTVLGMNAAFIGFLLMAARVFDAFNDPLMGIVVARTKSRFGRFKPWIFSGTILNALVMIAMFSVPFSLRGGSLNWYVVITYLLCGITFTFSDIPYWSIIPNITRAGAERESMTVIARTFAGIGAALPTVFTMTLIPLLGGGKSLSAYRIGFSRIAVITAVIFTVTGMITVFNLPNDRNDHGNELSVRELVETLIRNDHAMVIAIVIVSFNTAIYMTTNLALYLFRYDICDEGSYSIFMAVNGIVQLLAMTVFYPAMRKKMDNRKIYLIACIIAVLGYVVLFLMVFIKHMTLAGILIPGILVSFANGIAYVLTTIFVAGTVDYGERKTGHRADSVVSSLQTLMVKISSAVAVFIAGIGIDLVKLNTGEAVQLRETIVRLRLLFALPPMLFILIAILVFRYKKELGEDIIR